MLSFHVLGKKKAKKRTTLRKTIQKSSHVFNNKERVVFSKKKREHAHERERERECVCVCEKDECLPLVDVLEQRRKQARRSAF